MNQLAEALHGELPGPPVQGLYVYNSNPVAVAPDQNRVIQGMLRDDLFTVVHEQFPTDTCDYADIVLPATMQLEHFDLHSSYGHQWVQANFPILAPPGEARCNTDVFRGLARRMGFEPELFEPSDEDLARVALDEAAAQRPAALDGITLDTLRTAPQRLRVPENDAPFAEGRFGTPSGKCELYCERMAQQGYDPLPTWTPPAESPETTPDLAAKYPLQLLSPPSQHFLNSTFVEVDSLRQAARRPELWIHPDDAAARGVVEGAAVLIANDRGAFEATARVGTQARPGVVVAPGIWWNKHTSDRRNANVTSPTTLADMGGGATFFDNLVEVSPRRDPNSPSTQQSP